MIFLLIINIVIVIIIINNIIIIIIIVVVTIITIIVVVVVIIIISLSFTAFVLFLHVFQFGSQQVRAPTPDSRCLHHNPYPTRAHKVNYI